MKLNCKCRWWKMEEILSVMFVYSAINRVSFNAIFNTQ